MDMYHIHSHKNLLEGTGGIQVNYICTIYVTGPAKINHLNTNYTNLYFHQYLQFLNVVSHFCKLLKNAH